MLIFARKTREKKMKKEKIFIDSLFVLKNASIKSILIHLAYLKNISYQYRES